MTAEEARARAGYLAARVRFEIAAARADRAFLRWFRKNARGERTNGGAAGRLNWLANYASADLSVAEGPLWDLDIEPDSLWDGLVNPLTEGA